MPPPPASEAVSAPLCDIPVAGGDADGFADFNGLGGPLESAASTSSASPAATPTGPPTPTTSTPRAAATAKQPPTPHSHLHRLERALCDTNSAFGAELGRLALLDPAPVQPTALHLPVWLDELSQSATPVQAAHAYWAVSRGMRILPRGHQRRPTRSPNYFKQEHHGVVTAEFDRLRRSGKVFNVDGHFVPADILAVGCVVKPDKIRCVVNASAPEGRSINDDITEYTVAFPTLGDVGRCMSRGDVLWRSDASDYYLQFVLRPDQWPHVCVELGPLAVECIGQIRSVIVA